MIAIKNVKIVLEHSVIEEGLLLIDGEKIAFCGDKNDAVIPADCAIYDAPPLSASFLVNPRYHRRQTNNH